MKLFIKGFRKGLKDFGESISTIVNSILLMIVYLTGVAVTALFAKIFKKHFLETKLSKNAKTYWSDLDIKKKPMDEYYRQF